MSDLAVARAAVRDGVGAAVLRPDGVPKATGRFEFLGDQHAAGMLWGATRRAPVAHARILAVDVTPALARPGVHAVLTAADVPGHRYQGQKVTDEPVLAEGVVRRAGEPIAIVAADDPETARLAAAAVEVHLDELGPVTDLEEALARDAVFRHVRVRRGDPDARGEVVVEGCYETATQDPAPLGTEAGLAVPDGHGGLDLWGPTQWTHIDLPQLAACLALDPAQIRVHPARLGGAFGSREDLSLQTHLGMLALRTGRPVKMVYDRSESFVGHVKRHAAVMHYRHEADRDGRLVRVVARLLLDGGPYELTSAAVVANSTYFALGPYRCERVEVDGYALRTNNPLSGAMRGFGANQPCFAAESQMDRLAAALGLDPLELRLRNAIGPGDVLATTGQRIEYPLPVAEVIRSVAAIPLPDDDAVARGEDVVTTPGGDPRLLPGGAGRTTPPDAVVRGVGYAVGVKNLEFSEGFQDDAEARVELRADGAVVHTAAVEVGQGLVTILGQIARTALGLSEVRVVFDHTGAIGSAGSTSASRQTQMSGGAVLRAARAVRRQALERVGGEDLDDHGVWRDGRLVADLAELTADGPVTAAVRFRHPATDLPDADGQGTLHVDFCVAAHRAVVDVDPALGLVRVVEIAIAQDVGRVLNPLQLHGQIEGGIAQGMAHATMEEVLVERGVMRNATFTDYLLPTCLDAPEVEAVLVEEPSPWGPYGAKGMAELPTMSATPAVVAAIRAATGRALSRVPVRPQDLVELVGVGESEAREEPER
jgi:xanthine dehydrogenase D subunit